jgi:hypothetical protein
VGSTGLALRGLAVDPTDGWLWGSDASSKIYKIDGQTAVATLVGATGRPASPDLAFDQSGTLYAVSGGGLTTNNLIVIDKSTGAGTVIGPTGFPSVSGMAIRLDHIVPTLIQAYSSRWSGRQIELRWRLTEPDGDIAFTIDRAAGTNGYRRLEGSSVSREGDEFVFRDAAVEPGRTYRYRVDVVESGASVTSFETSITTPVMESSLEQNYPNPLHRATEVRYAVREAARVTLTVHDVTGRLVRVLENRVMDPGSHVATWDRRDERGAPVAGGVYFYRLRAGERVLERRMLVLE